LTDEPGLRRQRPVVLVDPVGAELEIEPGETIIEAAWRLGYKWPTVCFGQAICTACHFEVLSGGEHLTPVGDEERDVIEHHLSVPRGRDRTRLRLACRAQATGDVTVRKKGVRRPLAC
jgi:2Fe-2S ferredoxin